MCKVVHLTGVARARRRVSRRPAHSLRGAFPKATPREPLPDPPPAPRVWLRGIGKTFGSIEALRGVDLDLFPGECWGWSATTPPASRR